MRIFKIFDSLDLYCIFLKIKKIAEMRKESVQLLWQKESVQLSMTAFVFPETQI